MSEIIISAAEEISVVDVYDLASDIGKECEKIIDLFGSDAVTSLMPKVINALELLETLATRNESENTRVQELTDRITYLECEKQEKAVFRERFQKELEAIEEQWRTESNDLVALVSQLQEENRRYQRESDPNSADSSPSEITKSDSGTNLLTANDFQLIQRLRQQVETHRNDLKVKEQELQTKISEVENLSIQNERQSNSGRETRKRQKLLQVQVRSLVEERADFLAQLQDQHREIISLKKRLGIAEKENEDLSWSSLDDDPHRPRYTTAELKEILTERDDLKARICDLEEELKLYKPVEVNPIEQDPEEDPPVQGPLPYEPDDAPWKKSTESGIRKFFRKLFSEPDSTSFPRRSLSTLSKMALSASNYSDTTI